ncbi:hypothetical protein F4808DRAFT_83625 [Astrocystis sublimbata]|nr:hypothetical protein F4808DRAFT_83625 [Astrocystis sublimbata]
MSTSSNPAVSDAKESAESVPFQPSESSASYFPKDAATSTAIPTASGATTPGTPLTSLNYPLSPMDREYTKPPPDIDIAKQLSKQPTYWSAQGWVQRTASSEARPVVDDAEARTRKFEETKRDLLASARRF